VDEGCREVGMGGSRIRFQMNGPPAVVRQLSNFAIAGRKPAQEAHEPQSSWEPGAKGLPAERRPLEIVRRDNELPRTETLDPAGGLDCFQRLPTTRKPQQNKQSTTEAGPFLLTVHLRVSLSLRRKHPGTGSWLACPFRGVFILT